MSGGIRYVKQPSKGSGSITSAYFIPAIQGGNRKNIQYKNKEKRRKIFTMKII
jgi:hypothetical protein